MNYNYLRYPIETLRNKFYGELFRSNYYKELIKKDLKKALSLQYKAQHHEELNWDNPQTLDAKIMWLEVMTDTSIWSELTDKYNVRKYIEQKGYADNLPNCYGVWDRVEDIDYTTLPDKFVIKCTHDSGSTFIIKNKAKSKIGVTYDLFTLDDWTPKREFLSKKNANYKNIPKPKCLDEMLQIAKNLSAEFPLVRVDFYVINNKPYFGELTFTSSGGLNYFYSKLGQKEMGNAIDLSKIKRIR